VVTLTNPLAADIAASPVGMRPQQAMWVSRRNAQATCRPVLTSM
jgi:hypothetical protein